ncbi:MAG: radical SAM peptide maturase [Prevotella sp.]|jgi:uncharacterized protein|nr:radical SAM peptide maturase [Prevotella sp.]
MMEKDKTVCITGEDVMSSLVNTRQITFEVTDACNLKCEYCGYGKFYSDYDKRENRFLPLDHAKRFWNYMRQLWLSPYNKSIHNKLFVSFYGGEPLVNMEFIGNMIDYIENSCSASLPDINFSMTTNAILLNKYMDYLVEKRVSLLISLDGGEEATSYRVTPAGKNAFDRIVYNVDKLKEKYPLFFESNVSFNAVLHNRNSVEEICSFFKQRYNKIPAIGALNNTGIKDTMKDEFDRTYKNPTESLLDSENYTQIEQEMFLKAPTYRTATMFLLENSEFSFRNYNELLYGKKEIKNPIPTGTCLPFSKKVYITVNGKILPCERIGHQFSLGRITPDTIDLDFSAIANRYNEYFSKMQPSCSRCYARKGCYQCIFNVETINNKHPLCHGYMDRETFERYKNSQLHFFQTHPDAYAKIMNDVIIK